MEQPKLPDFLDKGTTQSFKETACAVALLLVIGRGHPTVSPASTLLRRAKQVALLVVLYKGFHLDPALVRQIFSL